MTRWLPLLVQRAFLLLMLLGSLFITLASLVYFESDTIAPFVIEKLPLRFETLWLASLKIHVASAILAFPLCLALMTRWLRRHVTWHRWLGRITGICVVGALVPSGIILSFQAKGGPVVTAGFLLSAMIVLFAMVYGVVYARRKQVSSHSRAMRHVVAQMSVAVTSRAMLIALDMVGMDPEPAYVLALWVPVVSSAVAAEWVSGQLSLSRIRVFHPLLRSPS